MPAVDTRRIAGPETSIPYTAYQANKDKNILDLSSRSEGRAVDSHRKIFLSTGVITQAKGSAYIEQGRTKVMVGVYGPREVQKRSDFSMAGVLTAELKFAPFACITRRGQQADREEQELGMVLGEALSSTVCLHRYPKSAIEVFVTVIEDDGGVVAASLTAAGLALADAGIHMFDIVVGSKVSLTKEEVVVDPDRTEQYGDEEGQILGEVTVGYLPSLEQVVACMCEGVIQTEDLARGLAAATQQAAIVLPAVQQELVEKLKKKKLKENDK